MTTLIESDLVTELPGVREATAAQLNKLGVTTIGELLTLLPHRLEDYSIITPIDKLQYNKITCIQGEIIKVSARKSKRGILMVEAIIQSGDHRIAALWFNQRFVLRMLKVGSNISLYGARAMMPSLNNPFIVKKIVTEHEISPIYPSTKLLGQRRLRKLIVSALEKAEIEALLPPKFISDNDLADKRELLRSVHLNPSEKSVAQLRNLLAAEELITLCCAIVTANSATATTNVAPFNLAAEQLIRAAAALPHKMTDDQKRAAWEIISDFQSGKVSNRLLYGEVGSGKTLVMLMCAGAVMLSGKKVVCMAPTTLLANQLFAHVSRYCKQLNKSAQLITAGNKKIEECDIYVGTHALINVSASMNNVGLVVVDEQHRFGVEQRSSIARANINAHSLMMTATPIPRTLAQTIFHHLSITYLTNRLPHQKKVETRIVKNHNRSLLYDDIENKLKNGEQGYIICPFIDISNEESDLLIQEELPDIKSIYKKLQKRFPLTKIGVVHGKLKSTERDEVVDAFLNNKISILLSSTIVEVGIDNKNATWLIVEGVDRFGLATLHQLRGRVGRGSAQSVCYLVDYTNSDNHARLNAMQRTSNGLELAELDLANRGAGEILGKIQSGNYLVKFSDLIDSEIIVRYYKMSQQIVEEGLAKYKKLNHRVQQLLQDYESVRS